MNRSHLSQPKQRRKSTAKPKASCDFVDCYEILQLSPNADFVTIERVFRFLGERFHPNNQKTGSENAFQQVLTAYRVLIDPERRAAYDAEYAAKQRLSRQVFDQSKGARDKKAAKEIRKGVISVLYAKRMKDLDHPSMSVLEIEDLTGCPPPSTSTSRSGTCERKRWSCWLTDRATQSPPSGWTSVKGGTNPVPRTQTQRLHPQRRSLPEIASCRCRRTRQLVMRCDHCRSCPPPCSIPIQYRSMMDPGSRPSLT